MAKRAAASRGRSAVRSNAPRRFAVPDVAAGGLLVCAAVLAYWPALGGQLIWDDTGHVTQTALQSWHGLWRIWFELGATQQYYPLLHSAFWLEHHLWGEAVVGYHLANVVLHAAAGLLVVAILRRLRLPGAWLGGFLFVLHPVQVEAVAWISEQKSTLSAVFYLAAALVYLHFDETRSKRQYCAAFGLFLLALASKTVTATLPAALLAVFWWRRGRIGLRRDALPLAPWIATGAAAGLFTAWVEGTVVGANGPDYSLSFVERCLVAGRAVWFYLGKLVWPSKLTFIYPRWSPDGSVWWQYLFPLGVLMALGGALALVRRSRGPLAAGLLYTGTLFPALGFFNVFPFVYSYVADHFQYLATLAILVPASAGLTLASGRLPASARRAVPLAAAGLLATLGVLTFRQSAMYRDEATLWQTTVARNPECWMAHNNLGLLWFRTPGREADARAEFEATVRLNPGYPNGHNNLGYLLLKMPGELPGATREFETAIRLAPSWPEPRLGLGDAWAQSGQFPKAVGDYEEAIRLRPEYQDAHAHLGAALAQMPGRKAEAVTECQTAVRLKPDDAESRTILAGLLSGMPGRTAEAMEQYRAAAKYRPDLAEAHYGLAGLLSRMPERREEAIAEYQQAIALRPEYAEAHVNLGAMLALEPGRLEDAIAEYRAALRYRPDYMEAHYNLGIALAKSPGNAAEAMSHLEEALRLRPDSETVRRAVEQVRRSAGK